MWSIFILSLAQNKKLLQGIFHQDYSSEVDWYSWTEMDEHYYLLIKSNYPM